MRWSLTEWVPQVREAGVPDKRSLLGWEANLGLFRLHRRDPLDPPKPRGGPFSFSARMEINPKFCGAPHLTQKRIKRARYRAPSIGCAPQQEYVSKPRHR